VRWRNGMARRKGMAGFVATGVVALAWPVMVEDGSGSRVGVDRDGLGLCGRGSKQLGQSPGVGLEGSVVVAARHRGVGWQVPNRGGMSRREGMGRWGRAWLIALGWQVPVWMDMERRVGIVGRRVGLARMVRVCSGPARRMEMGRLGVMRVGEACRNGEGGEGMSRLDQSQWVGLGRSGAVSRDGLDRHVVARRVSMGRVVLSGTNLDRHFGSGRAESIWSE
jgi:hypothetical protein